MPSCTPSARRTASSVTARILTSTSPMRPPSCSWATSACSSSSGLSPSFATRISPRRFCAIAGYRSCRSATGRPVGGRRQLVLGRGRREFVRWCAAGTAGALEVGAAGRGRPRAPRRLRRQLDRGRFLEQVTLAQPAQRRLLVVDLLGGAVDLFQHAALAPVVDALFEVGHVLGRAVALDELAPFAHLLVGHPPQIIAVGDHVRRQRDDDVRLDHLLLGVAEQEADQGDVTQDRHLLHGVRRRDR